MTHWYAFRTKGQREVPTVHALRRHGFTCRVMCKPDWRKKTRHHKVKSVLGPQPLPKWRPYIFLQVGDEDWFRLNSEELRIFAPCWPVGINSSVPRPLSAAGVELIHQSHKKAFPDSDWENFSDLPEPEDVLPPIDFGEGDSISVVDGVFRGYEGEVVKLTGKHARVLSPFFACPVDIPLDQIVKAA